MASRRDDVEPGAAGEPEQSWVDLARNVAGRHVGAEANRRLRGEGAGADRSWRVGAQGEHIIAEALTSLVTVTWANRVRGRGSPWWVLHSVEVGTGSSDIDHVVGGPPGVFTINTKPDTRYRDRQSRRGSGRRGREVHTQREAPPPGLWNVSFPPSA